MPYDKNYYLFILKEYSLTKIFYRPIFICYSQMQYWKLYGRENFIMSVLHIRRFSSAESK